MEGDWAVTAKLLNIREARVEQRVSRFVTGDTKALFRAAGPVIAGLFRIVFMPN